MKTLVKMMLVAALFGGAGLTVATAQTTTARTDKKGKDPKTAEERAEKHTQKMTASLALTPEQVTKVKAINLDKAQQMDKLRADAGGERKERWQQMKTINDAWDTELKAVFTADQYAKYQKEKQAEMDARKEKRQSRNTNVEQ